MSSAAPSRGHGPVSSGRLLPLLLGGVTLCALAVAAQGAVLTLLLAMLLPIGTLLLVRHPDAATSLAALILYTNAVAVALHVHGAPSIVAAFPLMLGLPIARDLLFRGWMPVATSALPFIMAFFVVQFIGTLLAHRPEDAMEGLETFALEGLLLYVLFTNAIRTPAVLKQVVWALIAAGAGMGALAAYQHLTGSYDRDFGGFSRIDADGIGFYTSGLEGADAPRQRRLGGPLGMPNRFAQIMAMLVPIALFQIRAVRAWAGKLAAAVGLVAILVGCALGFSRGAAVSLVLTFGLMFVMGYVRPRHLLAAALALFCVALVVPQYAIRLASLGDVAKLSANSSGPGLENADSSTRGRMTEMATAVLVFADHPIIGAGPRMYREHYVEYARIAGGRVRGGPRQAHNLALHIAAEHGMLGLLAFAGIIIVTFRDLTRARRRLERLRPDLAWIVVGLFFALVVYLTTSIFLHAAYVRYFWFVLAVAAAASQMRPETDTSAPMRLTRA